MFCFVHVLVGGLDECNNGVCMGEKERGEQKGVVGAGLSEGE